MKRKCPICNYNKNKLLYVKNFHDTSSSIVTKYDVVVCTECGFTFADNIPSQEEYNEYYEKMSKYEFKNIKNYASEHFIKHAKNVFHFINKNLEYINIPHRKKVMKVFDIGCSTGSLLKEFKNNGYINVSGIDPSPYCTQVVREKHNIIATTNTISELPLGDEKFDVIVLSAVLEHVVDLQEAMNKISSLQDVGDFLFIDVPNLQNFYRYIYVPFQQFNSEHVNYFSEYSLKNLLNMFGYEILDMREIDIKRTEQIIEPDIFLLAQKINKKESYFPESNSELSIEKYVEECENKEANIKSEFYKKVNEIEHLIIWGVGEHSKWLLDDKDILNKVVYFLDSDIKMNCKKFLNRNIYTPKKSSRIENFPIFISSWAHQKEIVDYIKKELKFKNELITLY